MFLQRPHKVGVARDKTGASQPSSIIIAHRRLGLSRIHTTRRYPRENPSTQPCRPCVVKTSSKYAIVRRVMNLGRQAGRQAGGQAGSRRSSCSSRSARPDCRSYFCHCRQIVPRIAASLRRRQNSNPHLQTEIDHTACRARAPLSHLQIHLHSSRPAIHNKPTGQ